MSIRLVDIIEADHEDLRNRSLATACMGLSVDDLLEESAALEQFRRRSDNLYERVRALLFLYAIHRFELPMRHDFPRGGRIAYSGWQQLIERRFEDALTVFLSSQEGAGANDAVSSGLAEAYRGLAFQTLADQVRSSVRSASGNRWMFQIERPSETPLRLRSELLKKPTDDDAFPVLRESTAVRMDLTHSAWSDIFFLAMDYPEGARVINASVDLGVRGRDPYPRPPIEVSLRVIDEPSLRLVSVDLGVVASITELSEVFDFAKDHLGLLKAGVIASGLVPPGVEGSSESLGELLAKMCGVGRGLEIVSIVHDIPKGSRLAVSTNLVASLIAVSMRATGQTSGLVGGLLESERRVVASRAILAEWLGGSGGGWQDSGGIWPGIKVIRGQVAGRSDPESGISHGRLLPEHEILVPGRLAETARAGLQDSLVLFHGGMAQNVGPVLEMVTEKYLLRSQPEWSARAHAVEGFDEILAALCDGDLPGLAKLTDRNFFQPIQTIIPTATNPFTEAIIERMRQRFGDAYRGFVMLGGMSGGGMGMFFEPQRREAACEALAETLSECKREYEDSLPFAMEPVIYDFTINDRGSTCVLETRTEAPMHPAYYTLMAPRNSRTKDSESRRGATDDDNGTDRRALDELLAHGGFDRHEHERIRTELQAGSIALSRNRLPASTVIEDAAGESVISTSNLSEDLEVRGRAALENGEVGVVTFAAGAASRWTQGAGVVKALNPFSRLGGGHRSFLEVHLAKSTQLARRYGSPLPHVVTTSLFTHEPIRRHLESVESYGYEGPLRLSPGRAVGLRFVPMARDLRFLWEETAQQILDEQAQKVRESLQAALIEWAKSAGEGSDYVDNLPTQCLHPVGHWYEIPNLLLNGVLADLLDERPQLRWLLAHNIDTVGVSADPARLGLFIERGRALSFEVIPRRIDDVGGGLARVNGRLRLVEGLAMPNEKVEFDLSYYNTATSWIDLDRLLELFGLSRADLRNEERVASAISRLGARIPTYVTIRDVKKRWGHGHEDIFPVAQFEKLWGDMTQLEEIEIDYFVVHRERGQQLKDPAQLDGWLRDGSAAAVERLAGWSVGA